MNNCLPLIPACLLTLAMTGCCQLRTSRVTARHLTYPMITRTVPPDVRYYGSDDAYDYFKVHDIISCKRKVPVAEHLIGHSDKYPFSSWSNGRKVYYNAFGLQVGVPAVRPSLIVYPPGREMLPAAIYTLSNTRFKGHESAKKGGFRN